MEFINNNSANEDEPQSKFKVILVLNNNSNLEIFSSDEHFKNEFLLVNNSNNLFDNIVCLDSTNKTSNHHYNILKSTIYNNHTTSVCLILRRNNGHTVPCHITVVSITGVSQASQSTLDGTSDNTHSNANKWAVVTIRYQSTIHNAIHFGLRQYIQMMTIQEQEQQYHHLQQQQQGLVNIVSREGSIDSINSLYNTHTNATHSEGAPVPPLNLTTLNPTTTTTNTHIDTLYEDLQKSTPRSDLTLTLNLNTTTTNILPYDTYTTNNNTNYTSNNNIPKYTSKYSDVDDIYTREATLNLSYIEVTKRMERMQQQLYGKVPVKPLKIRNRYLSKADKTRKLHNSKHTTATASYSNHKSNDVYSKVSKSNKVYKSHSTHNSTRHNSDGNTTHFDQYKTTPPVLAAGK